MPHAGTARRFIAFPFRYSSVTAGQFSQRESAFKVTVSPQVKTAPAAIHTRFNSIKYFPQSHLTHHVTLFYETLFTRLVFDFPLSLFV